MDKQGKDVDGDHHSVVSNRYRFSRNRKDMNPARQVFSHIITVIAVGVIALVCVMLLAQNRNLSREIKDQTAINQRYLRCILLIPSDEFKDVKLRVAAIDKCSRTSQLPNGAPIGQAPNQDGNRTESAPSKETTGTPEEQASRSTPAETVTKSANPGQQQAAPQSAPVVQLPKQPTLQSSAVDQVLNSVKEIVTL